VRLPDGGMLALEGAGHFDAPLRLGARQGGERITLPGRGHSHALKHVLQALGVPPWLRERLPLLSGPQGELLAAGDVVYSAHFDAWLRAKDARLHWSCAQD
jgi:tRNA(Ile)-lysidine synthase